MAIYTLQEASLELPDVFKDRTMNLFTLSENNASEFTFVVSRASAQHDDNVKKVAAKIVREMEVTLHGFKIEATRIIHVDTLPAVEIFYHFRNEGGEIWQKQTIVILDDEIVGKKIVCYIGTCPDNFSDYYNKQYQAIIDSIRFNHVEVVESVPVDSNSDAIFFSFDTDTKMINAYEAVQSLYQHVDLKRALHGNYLFFDAWGRSLHIAALNNQDPVRYALCTSPRSDASSLIQVLGLAKDFDGPEGLASEQDILQFLQRHKDV